MKPIFMFSLLFIFTACANYTRTVATKMISPEAKGELGKGSFELRYQSVKRDRIDISNDRLNNPMETLDTSYSVGMMAEIGLWTRLDFFVIPSITAAPLYALKYQILGAPAKTAKRGNTSLSVYAGTGSRSESGNSDDLDIKDGVIVFGDLDVEVDHTEVGLLYGYRWTDRLLNYLGVAYLREELNGHISSSSGTLQNQDFKYYQDGMIYSFGFIQHWSSVHLKLDYSHFISDWSHTRKDTENTFNFALGWHW